MMCTCICNSDFCNDEFHNGNDIVPCQFFDSGELYYGILDTLGRLLTFSPYLDTDQTEFFQYFEENFNGFLFRKGEKQNMSFIDPQERHQNVQKLQGKTL